MLNPVNLVNLREITGGDFELELSLFEEFISSSNNLVKNLEQALQNKDCESWRKSAHSLKGVAFNLGATKLGELSKKAQENYKESNEKNEMLETIIDEHKKVIEFLNTEISVLKSSSR